MVIVLDTTVAASDSTIGGHNVDSFDKDGRKITVGDCALIKHTQETSPPFIGIIRWLTPVKGDYPRLGVNWLYRPSDVKLSKAVSAAPNEIFYSFHEDEIPAASLLHPCKVAFLRKGVELPPGISSFVCRRVYDTTNKRLWWLTDQDYINERQQEVDQLLSKTRKEMHIAVTGGRSPKTLNGPSTPQSKSGADGVQNSFTSTSSQVKGKKRDRGDHSSEPIKRERPTKVDDGDCGNFKSDIAKIADKGGLLDYTGVEKLVELMQPDKVEKKLDIACRTMIADVIVATDRYDCLGQFVHLKGLSVLDEWLQEVHKGRIGDGSSPKESDKSVDDFLLASLRALEKLPVNLHALQSCNVGKSVNNLRTHRNVEIQKKARSLVDTWKKRVEAEMKINDAKSGSTQAIPWSNKSGISESPHGGNRRTAGSSDVSAKNSISLSSCKTTPVKLGHGDSVARSTSTPPGSMKISVPSAASVVVSKDSPTDSALTAIKEERSSSSGQSQNNSQTCSGDPAKTVGSLWKEDVRSSPVRSMNTNKISSLSGNRKSSNGVLGVQKEATLAKCSSVDKKATSGKVLQSGSACERTCDIPTVDHGTNHRLIVKLPVPGRSPARSASCDDFSMKGKSDTSRGCLSASDVCMDSDQGNVAKDGLVGSNAEECGDETGKLSEVLKSKVKGSNISESKPGKSHEASFSSINALIEAGAALPSEDDLGMNLLASVAAGEMSKSDEVLPSGSPRSSPVPMDTQKQNRPDNGEDDYTEKPGSHRCEQVHVSTLDMKQTPDQCVKSELKPNCSVLKAKDKSEGGVDCGVNEVRETKTYVACSNGDHIQDFKPIVKNSLLDKIKKLEEDEIKKADLVDEKTVDSSNTGESEFVRNSLGNACIPAGEEGADDALLPSGSCTNLGFKNTDGFKADGMQERAQSENQRVEHESAGPLSADNGVAGGEASVVSGENNNVENLEVKEVLEEAAPIPSQATVQCMKSSGSKLSGIESEGCASIAEASSVAAGSETTSKLDFDLNEGFPVDEGNSQSDPVNPVVPPGSPSIHLPSPLLFSLVPMSGSIPGSVTVAAAAKGSFIPPENLLRNQGEIGWKGSAATSAFRPAEPRKILEMPLSTITDIPKHGRHPLDIDLNVADDRVFEEMASESCKPTRSSEMFGSSQAPNRSFSGLDLDLNKVDEEPDAVHFSASTSRRLTVPILPVRSSYSSGYSNGGEVNGLRDFDLNNGPSLDEVGTEPALPRQLAKNSMTFLPASGFRINNNEHGGNVSSWFPPGNYPAIALPSILPERVDQPQHSYPIVAPPGSQRIFGPPTGVGPDIYRGSVLSSSPAVAFSTATPYPYPGFPFGTSFPLSSTSYSGGPTTYVDASHLVGAASHYPRPYMVNLSDNGGAESNRKWMRQGLDLNAGPGGSTDFEGRGDERLPLVSRQLPVGSSQALVEEQMRMYQAAGAVMKRKEPDGGWDPERFGYKHPPWQ
ncbi:hypothetical protein GIB67_004263 [Kingdonia uniflora]|uniref:Uncharacterized protein n=1 Tax=Kingdonia uniflora TaxID=39325 RepID=A0A7J7MQY7_9MAGN|nr:hypothetical protein GIB67_004263 [Kingdonia uniflora]